MKKFEKLEQERERLHNLIENGASLGGIQLQSEILDKYIVDYYKQST